MERLWKGVKEMESTTPEVERNADIALLRDALVDAYDAIAHALNYRQEDHVHQHLQQAKVTIVDALHPENAGTPHDGGPDAR